MTSIISFMPRTIRPDDGFGERLQTLRKQRGWTQSQLADIIDSTKRAINYYETEGKYPPAPVVADLAEAFGIRIEEMMGRKSPSPQKGIVLETPKERRIWKKFKLVLELPDRDQQAVLRIVNNAVSAAQAHK